MNKLTFISEPDTVDGKCYALQNYNDRIIKTLLTVCEQNTKFYLLDTDNTNEWRDKIKNQIIETFDCNQRSLAYIVEHAR
jgi:hypothetical protein